MTDRTGHSEKRAMHVPVGFVTVAEAAKRTGLRERTIRDHLVTHMAARASQGEIPALFVGVRKFVLEAWVRATVDAASSFSWS